MSRVDIWPFSGGPFQTTCYLGRDRASGDAVLVDAAGEGAAIIHAIARRRCTLRWIICTHGHVDHVQAVAPIARATGARVCIHSEDAPALADPLLSGAALFGLHQEPSVADRLLTDGDTVEAGESIGLRVVHTPGHSPGSICLLGADFAFVGDLAFAGSIGRTDLPGGSDEQMAQSLRWLLTLPDSTLLYPGHGPATTVAAERRHNPFLVRL